MKRTLPLVKATAIYLICTILLTLGSYRLQAQGLSQGLGQGYVKTYIPPIAFSTDSIWNNSSILTFKFFLSDGVFWSDRNIFRFDIFDLYEEFPLYFAIPDDPVLNNTWLRFSKRIVQMFDSIGQQYPDAYGGFVLGIIPNDPRVRAGSPYPNQNNIFEMYTNSYDLRERFLPSNYFGILRISLVKDMDSAVGPTQALKGQPVTVTAINAIPGTYYLESIGNCISGDNIRISEEYIHSGGNFSITSYPVESSMVNCGNMLVHLRRKNLELLPLSAGYTYIAGQAFHIPYIGDTLVSPATAIDFDGVNDVAVIPNSATLNPPKFSIDTWVKWGRSGTAVNFICSKGNEVMELQTGGALSNNIRFIPAPGVYLDAGANTIAPDTWVHIAAVYDPAQSLAKLYINGVDVPLTNNGPNPLSTPVPTIPDNLVLGNRNSLNIQYFKGQIDEFRLWNRVLTPTEIQAYSSCNTAPSNTGLVVNLNMNQGVNMGNNSSITTLIDSSGNNNNASLYNFAWVGNFSNFVFSNATNIKGFIGVIPNIVVGTTSFQLPYTLNCGLVATHYSIGTYGNAMPNFTNVPLTALSGSPITVSLPANTNSGTYYFTLTLRNTSTGFENTLPFAIKIVNPAKALDFDGIDDFAAIPNNTTLSPSKFTIDTWVKWGRSGTAVNFICSKGQEAIELQTGGALSNNIRFIPAPGVYLDAGANTLAPDTWVHIAAVYDPAQSLAKLYINGVDVPLTNNGPNPLSTPVPTIPDNLILGNRNSLNFQFFKGQIDEFRLWNRVLTPTEIQAYSICNTAPATTGLLVNLTMNQGFVNDNNRSITSLFDSSGNSNHASLNNFFMGGLISTFVSSNATNTSNGKFISSIGTVATVAVGSTFFSLPYSIFTCGAVPIHYSVTAANIALPNFTNVPLTILSGGSPITIALPANLTIGTFNFVLKLRNNSSGYEVSYPFTITITDNALATERRGNALQLSGSNQYAQTAAPLSTATQNITMETWVKLNAAPATNVLVLYNGNGYGGNGHGLLITPTRRLVAYHHGIGFQENAGIPDLPLNKWMHIAYVLGTGNSVKVYLDGQEIISTFLSSNTPTTKFQIGDNSFNGEIDEVRFWNIARTAQDIRLNMHLTLPTGAAGLTNYYQFNDANATFANDWVGNKPASFVNAPTRVGSGANVSKGSSFMVSAPTAGVNYNFTGTGVTLNFGNTTTGNITVSRLEGPPTGTQLVSKTGFAVYAPYYWIIQNDWFGAANTGLNATVNFTTDSGFVSTNSQTNPSTIQLYQRQANGGNSLMSNKNATLANSLTGSIQFNGIDGFIQEFVVTNISSTTWNGSTWSNGNPSSILDAVIASNIAPSSFTCKALTINSGVALTTKGITATVNGNIINNGNGIASTGGLIVNANSALSGNNINFNGTLTVNSGATLTTNDKFTLSSNATATGSIGNSAGAINGNVTLQRFIAGGNSDGTPGKRGFRFLSHPFTSNVSLAPLRATGNIDITGVGGTTNGFDPTQTNNPSAFWYNPVAAGAGNANGGTGNDNGWVAYTSGNGVADGSNANTWKRGEGIRVLFRGAKGEGLTYNGTNYTLSNVTLSMSGAVNMGNQTFTLPAGGNDQWSLVGNPYASPINIRSLLATQKTNGLLVGATAYVFNPNKSGTTRGGYEAVDISSTGNYALPANGVILVQHKQALASNINFAETDKTVGADVGFRTQVQGTTVGIDLVDVASQEILDEYNLRFSNTAQQGTIGDVEDGGKLLNNYSLYSISEGDNKMLKIDSRPKPNTNQGACKVRLGLYSSMPKALVLKITDLNLPAGIVAFLKDNWLNQEQAITNSSYQYSFATTADTASKGNNRFELVFKQGVTLPVTFTQIKAQQQGNGSIQVSWQVANEVNIANYEVEESSNAQTFSKANNQTAQNKISYNWLDNNIQQGNNFYRVKAVDKSGNYQYSQVVNVRIGKEQNSISIYPNPAKGAMVNVQFGNAAKGIYSLQLYNSIGQLVATKQIEHQGGNATQSLQLSNSLSQGSYKLVISNGEAISINQTVIVE